MSKENIQVNVNAQEGNAVIKLIQVEESAAYRYKGFDYTLHSTESFAKLAKSHGTPEHSVIFYNEEGFAAILDNTVIDRPQDKANYQFKHSLPFLDWKGILGRTISQKEFMDFLKRRPAGQVQNGEMLLAQVQNLSYATELIGESVLDETGRTVSFAFKTKDKEETAKLPTVFFVNLEIYNESGLTQVLEVELEFKRPKGENDKPAFELTCPKLKQYIEDAAKHEVNKLKEMLDGYLILAGSPK